MADIDKLDNKKIVAFCDGKTNWARVLHTVQRRTGTITQAEFKSFASYDELTEYIEKHVAKDEDGSYLESDYEKLFIKDYDLLEYRVCRDKPELNHLSLYYYTIKDGKRHHIHLPVEFKNSLIETIKVSKGLPFSLSEDALDFYKVVYSYSEEFYKNESQLQFSYSSPRGASVERREYDYVPMKFSEPKRINTKTSSVKRLLIFATVFSFLLVAGKGVHKKFIEETHGNGYDCLTLDRLVDDVDIELYRERFNFVDTLEAFVKGEYGGLSTRHLEKFLRYVSKFNLSNYDNNESLNKIRLSDLKYLIKCDNIRDLKPMVDLIDKYDIKHGACFRRSNPKDNKPVLQNDKARSCLNWTLPMILLNCKNYSPRFSGVPISNGSSVNEHATSEEIRLFGLLPDAIRVLIIDSVQRMYIHVQNYSFQHPDYFGTDILQDLEIAKGECIFRMSQEIAKNANSVQNDSVDYNHGAK